MTLGGAAANLLRLLENGRVPPRGTGPAGVGGSGASRWISVTDVLVWNAKSDTRREQEEWDADEDPIRSRFFTEEEIPLRDYQIQACESAMPSNRDGRDVFKSGAIVMGCGDGKSRVAAELIRRSRAPAVILAPGTVCVDQWVELIREFVTEDVWTLADVRQHWKIQMPVPSVVVTTYHSLVRLTKQMKTHRELLESQESATLMFVEEHFEDRLLMMLMCQRFGLLIMDEVHVAVADYFISSGFLRASAVYGLSGSLVREDERMSRLTESVGPTLFSYFTQRNVHVDIVTCAMSEEHRARIDSLSKRSKWEQTLRAMNPYKVYALDTILRAHSADRVIVFCDIMCVAEILHAHYDGSFLMTGKDDTSTRDETLTAFQRKHDGAVLMCTHVGDASINFPPGCVVVQFHISSGSRQQEVQRCGRGTRNLSSMPTYMYHIVNNDSEEVEYVERRVTHLMECMPSGCSVSRSTVGLDVDLLDHHRLMSADAQRLVFYVKVGSSSRSKSKNHRRLDNLISKRKHGSASVS